MKLVDGAASFEAGYALLRESCGLIADFPLRFMAIHGEDRKAWLQGQLTNDLRELESGGSIAGCFCTPTGQLLAICRVWSLDGGYILGTHKGSFSAVAERFETHVVMEDVTAEPMDEWAPYSVQGPLATKCLSEFLELPTLDAGLVAFDNHEGIALRADHSGLGGWDILVSRSFSCAVESRLAKIGVITEESLNAAQVEAGIPQFGVDTDARTLPPELGEAFVAKSISYTKGCYTGQEVLMRIHSRGHTNRTWVGLICETMPSKGQPISVGSTTSAGHVTRTAYSPRFGPIAAGFLKNDFAHFGESVAIQTDSGPVQAEVRPMPILRLD